MKTPDEIKKGLECCAEYGNCSNGCPYNPIKDCGADLYSDALAYIKQLERERDAAVEQLKEADANQLFWCDHCKYEGTCIMSPCNSCVNQSNWQWRGVPEVE